MKAHWTKRVGSLLLLLLLVTATMGVSVHRMKCICTGDIAYSLYNPIECGAEDHGSEPIVHAVCCEYTQVTMRLEVESVINFDIQIELPVLELQELPVCLLPQVFKPEMPVYNNLSPPVPWGYELLKRIQVFRI